MPNDKKYPLFSPKLMQENTFAYVNRYYTPSLQEERTAGVVGCAIEEACKGNGVGYSIICDPITGLDKIVDGDYTNVFIEAINKMVLEWFKERWTPFKSSEIAYKCDLKRECIIDNMDQISNCIEITNRTKEEVFFRNFGSETPIFKARYKSHVIAQINRALENEHKEKLVKQRKKK